MKCRRGQQTMNPFYWFTHIAILVTLAYQQHRWASTDRTVCRESHRRSLDAKGGQSLLLGTTESCDPTHCGVGSTKHAGKFDRWQWDVSWLGDVPDHRHAWWWAPTCYQHCDLHWVAWSTSCVSVEALTQCQPYSWSLLPDLKAPGVPESPFHGCPPLSTPIMLFVGSQRVCNKFWRSAACYPCWSRKTMAKLLVSAKHVSSHAKHKNSLLMRLLLLLLLKGLMT